MARVEKYLDYVPIPNSEHVYVNGVEQRIDVDYTIEQQSLIVVKSEAESGDRVEVRYAHSGIPGIARVPFTGSVVASDFIPWSTACTTQGDYWSPPGYVPPGYEKLTSGPNNTFGTPRFDPNNAMVLSGSGFGSQTGYVRYYNTSQGSADNFGFINMYFVNTSGCIESGLVHNQLNYAQPNQSFEYTITAGVPYQGPSGIVSISAGSIYVRSIRVYSVNSQFFVTHDVGRNPFK